MAACNGDAKTVSVAVSAFEAENPNVTPTSSELTAAPVAGAVGGPYLKSWPNNPSYYTIAIDPSGDVTVALTNTTPGYKSGTTGAQIYDGTSAFAYSGEVSPYTALDTQNICAGA